MNLKEKYYKYQKNYFLAINKKNNALSQLLNNTYIQIGGGNELSKVKGTFKDLIMIDTLVKSNNEKIQKYLFELQTTLDILASKECEDNKSSDIIAKLEQKLNTSSEKAIILNSNLLTIKQELEDNKIEKKEIQEKLSKVTNQGSVNTEIIEKLKSDLENKNEEILKLKNEQLTKESLLQKSLDDLEREKKIIKKQAEEIIQLKGTEANEIKQLKGDLSRQNKELELKIHLLQNTQQDFKHISYEKEQSDARANQLERDNNKLKSEKEQSETRTNQLKRNYYKIKNEKEQSDIRANQLERDNKELKSEKDEIDKAYDELVEETNYIRDQFFDKKSKITKLNKYIQDKKKEQSYEVNNLKEELTKCKNNFGLCFEDNEYLMEQNKNLKSKVSTKKKSRVKRKTYTPAAKPAWNSRTGVTSGEYGFG